MDKFIEAYSRWPPINQLIFPCVAFLALILILFLAGVFLLQLARHLTVLVRGWPTKTTKSSLDPNTVTVLVRLRTLEGQVDRLLSHSAWRGVSMSSKLMPAKGLCAAEEQRQRFFEEQQLIAQEALAQAEYQAKLQAELFDGNSPAKPDEKPAAPEAVSGH